MPECLDCGNTEQNPNPLDSCSRPACDNPCGAGPSNTPQCETLPSQIENFTLQFFGEVVKTEQNGKVVWSLPCGLDIGLPNNPRGVGEGLACYFLRLFETGITGLKGDKGDQGNAGVNGNNAYSVTLRSFHQPSLAAPSIQVQTQFNPGVGLDGSYVFIDTSGWYQVTASDGQGNLSLVLIKLSSTPAGATVAAGKLVIVTGPPGASIKGDKGDAGVPGPPGPAGPEPTATNGFYFPQGGATTNANPDVTYAVLNFTSSNMQFLAPKAGTYLVVVATTIVANAGATSSDGFFMKVVDDSVASDVGVEMVETGFNVGDHRVMSITAIVHTDSDNHTISVYGKQSVLGHLNAQGFRSQLSWVRLE